jgi:hypothetical protein
MTLENDVKNFNSGGIELVDLTDPIAYEKFINWNGNSYDIQHLPIKYISKSYLDNLKSKNEMNVE